MQSFVCGTRLCFGADAPAALAGLHAERVLLVTDPYFAENGTAARYAAAFPGAQVEIFSDVAPDPPLSLVAQGVARLQALRPDTLLALGGGSAIDCAKGIAALGGLPVRLVAVPTTSGSGSEVTSFAILTQGGVKHPLVDPALRLTPDWNLTDLFSAEGAAYEDFVTIGEYIAAPATAADYDSDIRYMLAQGEHTLTVQNPAGFTIPAAQETLNAALLAVKRYCEQGYNNAACTYSPAGTMTVKFSSIAGDKTEEYRAEALSAAIAVHDRLWEQGVITAASTQRETAWAYYQWIAANCVYDDAGDNTSVSHLPYSVFHNGKAVCDGYTGAYNLLLKLEGIDCYALPNATHIWTVAVLDGKTVHIDATWGDQGATAAEEYFAMTPEQSYTLHPWPKENERPD